MPVSKTVINLNAGTATFITELDAAQAKLREFGGTATSQHKAAAAAGKVLEGQLFNNARAMDQFLITTLKLGPVMAAAFPIIGLVAFAGTLVETGTKVRDFFKQLSEAPAKNRAAWDTLSGSMRLTNAQLDLSNAKLQEQIDKIEGRRNNGLSVALNEARVSALQLGQELEKDVESIQKLLKEENTNALSHFFFNTPDTTGQQKIFGAKPQHALHEIDKAADQRFDYIQSQLDGGKISQTEANKLIDQASQAYVELGRRTVLNPIRKQLADKDAALATEYPQKGQAYEIPGHSSGGGRFAVPARSVPEDANIQGQFATQLRLHDAADDIDAQIKRRQQDAQLKKRLGTDQQKEQNAKPGEVYADALDKLKAEIAQIQEKTKNIGLSQALQDSAKAAGEAGLKIAEINKQLKALHAKPDTGKEAEIQAAELKKATTSSEEEYKTKLLSTTTALKERIAEQQRLGQAVGQGYQAIRQLAVETAKADFIRSNGKVGDASFLTDHKADIDAQGELGGRLSDSTNSAQANKTSEALKKQIQLEKELAIAELSGAEAVRQVEHAYRLREIALDDNADAAKVLIDLENQLFNGQSEAHTNTIITKIKEQTDAEIKLGEAVWKGAEATRQAQLNNKYAELRKNTTGTPDQINAVVQAEIAKDQAAHLTQVNEEAAKITNQYSDQIEKLNQIKTALQTEIDKRHNITENVIAMKDVEDQILQVMVRQQLQLGTLQSGFKAFFLEMEEQAKKPGQILFDSLNKSLDDISTEMSKLLTGQQTSWAKTFQGIGQSLSKEATQSALHTGLGKLGQALFPTTSHKADGSQSSPWCVRIVGGGGGIGHGGGIPGFHLPSTDPGSGEGPEFDGTPDSGDRASDGTSGFLGSLAKLGTSALPLLKRFLPFLAEGGEVMPNQSVVVGDGGDGSGAEIFTPRTAGTVSPIDRSHGGSGGMTINVHGPNAELGAASRISRAIEIAHRSAIQTSVKATDDRKRRTPRTRK